MKPVPRRLLILGGGPVGVEMAQAVRRLGGEVVLVYGAAHVLAREPAPLGHALGDVLRRDGIELVLGAHATAARCARSGDERVARGRSEEFVLELDGARELRGDRLLVGTGRRPRVTDIGLETVGIEADGHGIPVDAQLRAARARATRPDRRRHRRQRRHRTRNDPARTRRGRRRHPHRPQSRAPRARRGRARRPQPCSPGARTAARA